MDNLKEIGNRLTRIENLLLSNKLVLTLDEVAICTGYTKSYIYKLTSSGSIPHYKPNGKNIFFNKLEIENWLLRNPVKTNLSIEQEAITYTTNNKK